MRVCVAGDNDPPAGQDPEREACGAAQADHERTDPRTAHGSHDGGHRGYPWASRGSPHQRQVRSVGGDETSFKSSAVVER